MTREQLIDILNTSIANGRDRDIRLTCDDGDYIYVTCCGYGDIKSVDDCDYFLIDAAMPWLGGSTIDAVLKAVNEYSKLKNEAKEERRKLRAYRDKYAPLDWPDDTFDFYSDWYKDVYGHRPR